MAEELAADPLLVNERAARKEAAKRRLATSETLAILDRAADKALIEFVAAFERLKQTNFYLPAAVEQLYPRSMLHAIVSRPLPCSKTLIIDTVPMAATLSLTHRVAACSVNYDLPLTGNA